jgi:arylsulfatase A-like enzyme
MYFGTMMAIWAQHTTLLDILFASPLLIYATVLAPVVGGMGVRELVFVALLGATSGAASAATFAHLGWWVGDMTPFLVGWGLFVFKPVRTKAETQARWAEMREQARVSDDSLHLPHEQIRVYRERLVDYALCGVLGGLLAGALIGFGEAKWLTGQSAEFTELGVLCWGPLVYGIIFAGVGIGFAACAAFLSLLLDRFASRKWVFAWAFGKILGLGALGIGGFRFWRDVLMKHNPTPSQLAVMVGSSAAIALIGMLVAVVLLSFLKTTRVVAVGVALAFYLLIVSTGGLLAKSATLHPTRLAFNPAQKAAGPNIIFLGIDTLRADYLKLYNPQARPNTPHIDALANDAIVYRKCFSQASWTKPSFATMFTGRYPSSHTVTTQDSVIPNEITTLADALLAGGYYTQGYSNNLNIARIWNFKKGFVDYEDLLSNTYFGAPESATSMTLYQGLRKARARVFKATVVSDYYQPAEVVNKTAFAWLDSVLRPKDAPFYLFLHFMDCHDPYIDHKHPGRAYARAAMENPDPEKYTDVFKEVYSGDVEYLDARLGEFFDGLRQRGLYDNSIVVLTGDHGEEFYEHHGWWHGKTLYDEQTHVPLLIKLPGNVHGDNAHFARHVDLAPTLLSLAKLPKVAEMQGIALIADAGAPANESTASVYSENDFEGNELQAYRTDDHKLIRANADNTRNLKPVELYDLKADPGELSNLAGAGRPEEADYGAQLIGMREYVLGHAAEPVVVKSTSDATRERLNAIGYLQN